MKIKLIMLITCISVILTSCQLTTNVIEEVSLIEKTDIVEQILSFIIEPKEDELVDESIAIYYDFTYEEAAQEIMQHLINKEVEEIASLFSDQAKETCDLIQEVNDAITFIDGEIISYNDPDARNSSGSYSNHEYTSYNYKCEISNVVTDVGKTYLIIIFTCVIDADNEDNVGVTQISVIDEEEFTHENDYPDEAKFVIG